MEKVRKLTGELRLYCRLFYNGKINYWLNERECDFDTVVDLLLPWEDSMLGASISVDDVFDKLYEGKGITLVVPFDEDEVVLHAGVVKSFGLVEALKELSLHFRDCEVVTDILSGTISGDYGDYYTAYNGEIILHHVNIRKNKK